MSWDRRFNLASIRYIRGSVTFQSHGTWMADTLNTQKLFFPHFLKDFLNSNWDPFEGKKKRVLWDWAERIVAKSRLPPSAQYSLAWGQIAVSPVQSNGILWPFFIGVATLSFLKFKSEFSHLHDLDSHVKWDFENPLVFVICLASSSQRVENTLFWPVKQKHASVGGVQR